MGKYIILSRVTRRALETAVNFELQSTTVIRLVDLLQADQVNGTTVGQLRYDLHLQSSTTTWTSLTKFDTLIKRGNIRMASYWCCH